MGVVDFLKDFTYLFENIVRGRNSGITFFLGERVADSLH